MPPTRKEVIEYIANLSVEEMNDFLRELSGALGVDLSANLGNPPPPEPFTTMGMPYRDPSDLDPQYGYCGTRITLQEVGPNRTGLSRCLLALSRSKQFSGGNMWGIFV